MIWLLDNPRILISLQPNFLERSHKRNLLWTLFFESFCGHLVCKSLLQLITFLRASARLITCICSILSFSLVPKHVQCIVNILNLLLVYIIASGPFIFACFCLLYPLYQKNSDGQTMLASTLIPQPYLMTRAPLEKDVNMSFGRFVYSLCIKDCILLINLFWAGSIYEIMLHELKIKGIKFFSSSSKSFFWWITFFSCSMLLHGLTLSENDGDLEVMWFFGNLNSKDNSSTSWICWIVSSLHT